MIIYAFVHERVLFYNTSNGCNGAMLLKNIFKKNDVARNKKRTDVSVYAGAAGKVVLSRVIFKVNQNSR